MKKRLGSNLISVSLFLFSCSLISASAAQAAQPCSGWREDFNTGQLNRSRWTIGTGQAPGYIPNQHLGNYLRSNVSLSGGVLTLALTQQLGTVDGNPSGVLSHGGIIYTNFACGYGTYEWQMRMSSTGNCPICAGFPVSGSVSAGFLYVNNSQTEIDFEFTATDLTNIWLTNWLNPNPKADPTSANATSTGTPQPDATSAFHTYKFVWAPGIITYYIDGNVTATHTSNVPSAPAYFMINHWGTDSTYWGGLATLGTPRYFFVTRASYTPLP